MKASMKTRRASRRKRQRRGRRKLTVSAERPRVSVFRSHRHIYAQVVDDEAALRGAGGARVLAAVSSRKIATDGEVPEGVAGKCAVAYLVGRELAERARAEGLQRIVFDRSGYLYHGRVAALARGLREGGLEF
jgi:large subunit ribosomal protein L18